jgi:hypothetical protein
MQEGEARIKPAKRGPSHARSNGAPHGHVLNFVIASPTLPRQRELSLLGTEPGIHAEMKEEGLHVLRAVPMPMNMLEIFCVVTDQKISDIMRHRKAITLPRVG